MKAVIFDIFGVFYKPGFFLFGSYDEEMIALAQDLRSKGVKVFALSNSFREFKPLSECFDKIYFGSETGFYKPDVKVLNFLLEKENLRSENCLYFDDSKSNIKMGESAGVSSFLFESAKGAKEIIKSFLL